MFTRHTREEQIKKNYHRLARENHPDLHPEPLRGKQHLKMMQINEAFMAVTAYRKNHTSIDEDILSENLAPAAESCINIPDAPMPGATPPARDKAYFYYKQGFDYYRKGQEIFHKRFKLPGNGRVRNIFLGKKDLLNLAITAIRNFEKSYACFLTVVNEFPDSIWLSDSMDKLKSLEHINSIYSKICQNINSMH